MGRERESVALRELLAKERLVTLTGPAGVGKTRLALETARDLLERFPDGIWLVELAPLTDPVLVPGAVARAAGISEAGSLPITQRLLEASRRQHILIVLDNCEHLIAAAAEVAHALLQHCPQVHLLATSREALNVPGERVMRVPSLDVPPRGALVNAKDAAKYAAVALFNDRAQAADARFVLTDDIAPIAGKIARRLDGIPLAIELAAARANVLSVPSLAQRLDERFRVLTGGSRTAPPRHQTMRAAIDWSYDLLCESERALFRRVSVFAGGWTLEAAEAVCCNDLLGADEVLDVLSALVEKSLVAVDFEGSTLRYRLLESTREYALDRLVECGERTALAQQHAEWVGSFVERAFELTWTEPLSPWLTSVEFEGDNIRAALKWALDGGGDPALAGLIAGKLTYYWFARAQAEGRHWVETALERLDKARDPAIVAQLWCTLARLTFAKRATEFAAEAVSLFGMVADRSGRARALLVLAWALHETGEFEKGTTTIDQALQLLREANLMRTRPFASALGVRGSILYARGRIDDARIAFGEALVLSESIGDERLAAQMRGNFADLEFASGEARRALELATIAAGSSGLCGTEMQAHAFVNAAVYSLALGEAPAAQVAARAGLLLAHRLQLSQWAVFAIQHLAAARALQGDALPAARFLGYVDAWFLREGFERERTEVESRQILMAALRTQLGEHEIAIFAAEGAQLDDDGAVDEVLLAF